MRDYKKLLSDKRTYFDLRESDFKLTPNQKSSIINCIENTGNQLAGVSYNIFDPEICKYAAYVYVKLKSNGYDKDFITNKIRNLIGEFFSDIKSDIFIPKSDIIHLLKSEISEIDGVNVYFLSERNEKAIQTHKYVNKVYSYNPSTGTYDTRRETVYLYEGENPNLGLDAHGNIYLENDSQFPVLMGGWDYLNKENDEVTITDPLIIVYE
jgi:predicted HNH restriction endonuclease